MSLMQEIARPASPLPTGVGRRVRVGYLSPHNPHDRTAFSGTAHHMVRALAARGDISLTILGGHRPVGLAHRLMRRFGRARDIDPARIDYTGLDLVIGLAASDLIAQIPATMRVPVLHVTDATPGFLREVYGWAVPPSADTIERQVVARAALTVYSSLHMARRAADEFGHIARDAACVPFGTNLDTPPTAAPAKAATGPLRLLWVGRQWDRKGGPLAVAMLDLLRARGVDAVLTLVGDVPAAVKDHPGVAAIGPLDRNRPGESLRLSGLYAAAHLFVLPTRADCTPMVIAEANAHATPVLVTDVGGVASLVVPGRTGQMLPLSAGPVDWAEAAAGMLKDPVRHGQLCRAAFDHANQRLTWSAWAQDVIALATLPRVRAA